MIFLADALDFSPIKPDVGLFLWTTIIFLLFWFFVGRFAFRPIKDALKKRENDIQDALDQAEKAKAEMANLKAENDKILAQAREERSAILREAKETKDSIIKEAREGAKTEANKILASAKMEIDNQKQAAITEVKNMTGQMAIQIAEKVLRNDLSDASKQDALVGNLMDELNLN